MGRWASLSITDLPCNKGAVLSKSKGRKSTKTEQEVRENQKIKDKMPITNLHLTIITVYANGLNSSMKGTEWPQDQETKPNFLL